MNAEDAANGFLPTPGTITAYREPAGPGVRVDGRRGRVQVAGIYDPLLAKLCVWDTDRERARRRMLRALSEYAIEGVTTLVGFHRALLEHPCFVDGTTCHGLVESPELAARGQELVPTADGGARVAARTLGRSVDVEIDGRRFAVTLAEPEPPHAELARRRAERVSGGGSHAAAREAVVDPMQGTVLAVECPKGTRSRLAASSA